VSDLGACGVVGTAFVVVVVAVVSAWGCDELGAASTVVVAVAPSPSVLLVWPAVTDRRVLSVSERVEAVGPVLACSATAVVAAGVLEEEVVVEALPTVLAVVRTIESSCEDAVAVVLAVVVGAGGRVVVVEEVVEKEVVVDEGGRVVLAVVEEDAAKELEVGRGGVRVALVEVRVLDDDVARMVVAVVGSADVPRVVVEVGRVVVVTGMPLIMMITIPEFAVVAGRGGAVVRALVDVVTASVEAALVVPLVGRIVDSTLAGEVVRTVVAGMVVRSVVGGTVRTVVAGRVVVKQDGAAPGLKE
jgi:hypothetical protein